MIGIFDSGIGGLTVVKELLRQMPGYDTVYFGDTARTPYGNKSPATVRRYALEDADFLLSQGAKLIVVACNTVSATAMPELRRHLAGRDVPVIEVVTPAVAAATRTAAALEAAGRKRGTLAVIGTRATINSGIYEKKLAAVAPGLKIIAAPCPLFVPLVEEDWLQRPETLAVAKRYLSPIRWPRAEALILGCTHYPFLKPIIRKAVGSRVKLIDPAKETVRSLRRLLAERPELERRLSRGGRHRFYVSDRTEQAVRLARKWLGLPVDLHQVNLSVE